MVATAENLIRNLTCCVCISYNNLFTFSNHDPANGSGIMSGSFSAPTERLYLQGMNSIRQFNKAS
jgi:hypothetical protein